METFDVNAVQTLYEEACERHGVSQHQAIRTAFARMKSQKTAGDSGCSREPLVFDLILDQMIQVDYPPLMDVLLLPKVFHVDIVDVLLNNTSASGNGLFVLQLLRAVGSKLRMLDLKDMAFGREALRGLFQGGLPCQILDLSFARVRKLDMIGNFPSLHTLNLDYSFPVNNLPEGCFQSMPKLARLSMCGTGVANLWTTCAALSKLPDLVELRFQKCVCCSATGQCAAGSSNEGTGPWFRDNLVLSGKNPRWGWGSLNADDYDSPDTLRSEISQSEEEESDDLFSDEDWPLNHIQVNSSSGESSAESEMDFQGEVDEGQSMEFTAEDDTNYHGDAEGEREGVFTGLGSGGSNIHGLNTVDILDENIHGNSFIPGQEEVLTLEGRRTMEADAVQYPHEGLRSFDEIAGSEDDIQGTSHGSSSNAFTSPVSEAFLRSSPTRRRNSGGVSEGESSEDEEQEQCSLVMPKTTIASRLSGARHAAPICTQKHYREFMVISLPGLKVLDNVSVTDTEKDRARRVYVEHFELLPNNRKSENVTKVLKRREIGGWGVGPTSTEKRRIGMTVEGKSTAAVCRSLCAAKMASCAWPMTSTICRLKKSNLDLSRSCKPRQFEYHPTEASYMVFGTLSGEVVVVNHESDKVVGCVRSIGAPHSILGLCWLNKDPNKLIAGSDNGSLQLYDVNHMRATMIMAGQTDPRVAFGNTPRYWASQRNGNRGSRSPAIYTYDDFEQLTSVHINSTDDYFLASGYSKNVGLYDLRTGKRLNIFPNLHQEHINVVKFAHHSPFLFATSSFDKEIKMWDVRTKANRPLYTMRSNGGNVMVCFSRDDHYLLSSAVDNEVRQHLAVDGRLHMKFDIRPLGSHQNFTRSYYMNGRDYIITGSCEENVVRICCAQTGRHLRDLSLEGRGLKKSLYVQSLRGDPFRDFHFCVLVAYNLGHSRSEIVKVNMLASNFHPKGLECEPQLLPLTGMGA